MQKWEYEMRRDCSVAELNEMGEEEWELASTVYLADRDNIYFYFKRPLED
jgi:hypothetical protein